MSWIINHGMFAVFPEEYSYHLFKGHNLYMECLFQELRLNFLPDVGELSKYNRK